MNIFHAVGFVVFYAFYVAVVIVGRIVYQKWKKYRRNKRLGTGDIPSKSLFIDCCVSDCSMSVHIMSKSLFIKLSAVRLIVA